MTRAEELRAWFYSLSPDKQEVERAHAEAILGVHQERYKQARQRYIANHGGKPHQSEGRRSNTAQRGLDKRWRADFLHLGIPCQACGGWDRLEVSHVLPVASDPVQDAQLVQWLCHECHLLYDRAQRTPT